MEKIELKSKNIVARNYFDKLATSDISAFLYLKTELQMQEIKSIDFDVDIFDLLNFAIELNRVIVLAENYSGFFCDNYNKIQELYSNTKAEIEQVLGFER